MATRMPTISSFDAPPRFASEDLPEPGTKRSLPRITPEARRYAVKELARRAGVSKDFFKKWTIDAGRELTTVSFGQDSKAEIQFVHQADESLAAIAHREIPVARARGLNGRGDELGEPDLICPFCSSNADSREPLYGPTDGDRLTCRLDILASVLFALARVEEGLGGTFDEHGRFPASASLGVRHEFLERPILDEHGLAFQQALSRLFPNWIPERRILKLKLTHDIDSVGIPFEPRTSIAHTLMRSRPASTLQDFLSLFSGVLPAELAKVLSLADISSSRGLSSAFFWKGSPRGPYDSGYDPAHGKVQRVIGALRDRGFELGVHPGYETFDSLVNLAREVDTLRQALQVRSPGGRQHYLRWTPDTWLHWEACGLSYDSSLGFADRFGFRAGTAYPYHPWCFRENRELDLFEAPLILMDCTPVKYMKLSCEDALQRIGSIVQKMKRTGGVFTLLWHNTPLLDPTFDGWYESILDLLADAKDFGFPEKNEELW